MWFNSPVSSGLPFLVQTPLDNTAGGLQFNAVTLSALHRAHTLVFPTLLSKLGLTSKALLVLFTGSSLLSPLL